MEHNGYIYMHFVYEDYSYKLDRTHLKRNSRKTIWVSGNKATIGLNK